MTQPVPKYRTSIVLPRDEARRARSAPPKEKMGTATSRRRRVRGLTGAIGAGMEINSFCFF
jgi:hypothetical protein